jgi:L-proline amide hydrolase
VAFAETEGTMSFRDGETWFRVVGEITRDSTPLVLLHGGPGGTHQYLLSLARLARPGRPVIFYDQLGCGRSSRFRDRGADFYTVDLFLDELDALLAHCGIADRYHLLVNPGVECWPPSTRCVVLRGCGDW